MKTTTATTHAAHDDIPVDVVDALARALAAALVERYRHDEAIRNPAPRRGSTHNGPDPKEPRTL